MGLDYSYTQPSSSDEYDITSVLQEEADLYADEAQSQYQIAGAYHYEGQPEADDGIPRTCYCGGSPVIKTAYTSKDPGRRYYTCDNADDGDCHIWKWCDVAVLEEMSEFQRQLRELKAQSDVNASKLFKVEGTIGELSKREVEEELERIPTTMPVFEIVCIKSSVDLESPEPDWLGSQGPAPPVAKSPVVERRKWSPIEDKILIGAWLNTSKDPIIGNEQKAGAFWQRIVDYYNASPQLVGTVPRELVQCKKRWGRINEQVCKFVGCYNAALREQKSGENDDDVMKAALDSFFNAYSLKFCLEHAWRELRHDQKWSSTSLPKDVGKEKRRQVDGDDEVGEPEIRPIGVKAAKAASKRKKSGKEEALSQIQVIMEVKQKLSKEKLLERLLAKKEPLTETETAFKEKLMSEML